MDIRLPYTEKNKYWVQKDQLKCARATKFIGRGRNWSSTGQYAKVIGPQLANCGQYDDQDVVWISAEGNRNGRLQAPWAEIDKAIKAGVTAFITDNYENRTREYNVGEREVAQYLHDRGYSDPVGTGVWMQVVEERQ